VQTSIPTTLDKQFIGFRIICQKEEKEEEEEESLGLFVWRWDCEGPGLFYLPPNINLYKD